jgi:hypothetical protein
VTNTNPLNPGPAHRVGKRIQRVANQPEYVPHADAFERIDQKLCHRLRHLDLAREPPVIGLLERMQNTIT